MCTYGRINCTRCGTPAGFKLIRKCRPVRRGRECTGVNMDGPETTEGFCNECQGMTNGNWYREDEVMAPWGSGIFGEGQQVLRCPIHSFTGSSQIKCALLYMCGYKYREYLSGYPMTTPPYHQLTLTIMDLLLPSSKNQVVFVANLFHGSRGAF